MSEANGGSSRPVRERWHERLSVRVAAVVFVLMFVRGLVELWLGE